MGWAAVVMVVEGRRSVARSLWRPEEEELSGKCVRARVRSIVRPTDAAALSGRKKRESERGGKTGVSLSLSLSFPTPADNEACLPPSVRSFVRPAVSYNRLSSSSSFPPFALPNILPSSSSFSVGGAQPTREGGVCVRERRRGNKALLRDISHRCKEEKISPISNTIHHHHTFAETKHNHYNQRERESIRITV